MQVLQPLSKPNLVANDSNLLPHYPLNLGKRAVVNSPVSSSSEIGIPRSGSLNLIKGLIRGARPCPRAKHQTLKQRVGGKPVSSVNPGAGYLARRVQPGNRRSSMRICLDASHYVVRRRTHRNQIASDIHVVQQARIEYGRKPSTHKVPIQMTHVQPDVIRLLARHLEVNRAAYDVARR